MVEACLLSSGYGRRPEPDAAKLKCLAKKAKAELLQACEVPVPESDTEQSSVREDVVDDGMVVGEGTPRPEDEVEEQHAPFLTIRGEWVSQKGQCTIFEDHRTSRLSYEESLDNGCRLHGFLSALEGPPEDGVTLALQAALVILDEDQTPWYGPSFGEEPESVGDIQVRFCPGPPSTVETRIRVAGEDDDWQPPSTFRRKPKAAPVDGGDVFVFGGSSPH